MLLETDFTSKHLFEHFIQTMDRNTDWALCRYEYISSDSVSKIYEIVDKFSIFLADK